MKETPAQNFGRAGSIEIIILFTAFIAATYGFGIYLFASLGLAWNLVGGYAGQLSLGHSLYVGVGAYVAAGLFVTGSFPRGLPFFKVAPITTPATMAMAITLIQTADRPLVATAPCDDGLFCAFFLCLDMADRLMIDGHANPTKPGPARHQLRLFSERLVVGSCLLQPRVARNELPWVIVREPTSVALTARSEGVGMGMGFDHVSFGVRGTATPAISQSPPDSPRDVPAR